MFRLALVLPLLGLMLAGCAASNSAPGSSAPTVVGVPTATASPAAPTDALSKLRNFTVGDLQAASADAKAQIPPDITASQCYDFLGANLPTLPGIQPGQTVGAILAFQKARDLVNGGTSANGFLKSLNLACAPLVNDVNITLAKLGLIAGGTAATGGALGPLIGGLPAIGAALPIPLP